MFGIERLIAIGERASAYVEGAQGTESTRFETVEEAVELRDYGVELPILLLGGMRPEEAWVVVEHDLAPGTREHLRAGAAGGPGADHQHLAAARQGLHGWKF